MVLSLTMALAVDRRIPGRGFLRLAYFTPTILPMIAVANIWLYSFTSGHGLIDTALAPFGPGDLNWLGTASTVPLVVAVPLFQRQFLQSFMRARAGGEGHHDGGF